VPGPGAGRLATAAELVRRAIRTGATRISVSFGRPDQVTVADDGAGVAQPLVALTAALVDAHREKEDRHQALAGLEQAGELPLLALAGSSGCASCPSTPATGNTATGWHSAGAGRPRCRAPRPRGWRRRSASRLPRSPRRAARWLLEVARFAPALVSIDGRPRPMGWPSALAQAPLPPPLRGRMALLPEGDSAVAYLLAHGLVGAHITIPDAP
jgi:hypothetical protein